MSRRRSISPGPSHQDDGGDETLHEPAIKQRKLDHCTHLPVINIQYLPDEIFLMIFEFLTSSNLADCAQICKRWQRITQDPVLWRKKKFCISRSHSDTDVMDLLHKLPQLQKLTMKRAVGAPVINVLSQKCKQLHKLKMDERQKISESLMKRLLNNCQNIQNLTIPSVHLGDERKSLILAKLQQLQALHITDSYVFGVSIHLRALADGCPKLTNLKVDFVVDASTTEINYFIKVKSQTLTHLKLPWWWLRKRGIHLQLRTCTSLEFLYLEDWDIFLKDEDLEAFTTLSHLPTLNSLILRLHWAYKAERTTDVLRSGGLSHLQMLELNYSKIKNSLMEAVYEGCSQLQEFHLRNCLITSDEPLRELYRLRKLEVLAITGCECLGGTAITYVAQVPTLRKLFIEKCNLKDLEPGLECLLNISSLEVLSFNYTHYACNFPFNRIPGKLSSLRILKVSACELDKRILQRLKDQMPHLWIYADVSIDRDT